MKREKYITYNIRDSQGTMDKPNQLIRNVSLSTQTHKLTCNGLFHWSITLLPTAC